MLTLSDSISESFKYRHHGAREMIWFIECDYISTGYRQFVNRWKVILLNLSG